MPQQKIFSSVRPQRLTRAGRGYAWARTVQRFSDERRIDSAAALSFYFLLATVPALGAAISTISVFGRGPQTVTSLLTWLTQVTGSQQAMAAEEPLMTLARSSANIFVFVIGIAVSLWSAGKFVGAFGTVVNSLYGIPEGRPYWYLRLQSFILTIILIPLVAAALVCIAGQADLIEAIGVHGTFVVIWQVARIPVAILLGYLIIVALNTLSSNVKRKRLATSSLGSLVALLAWAILTALLYLFAAMGGFSSTYGALSGVLLVLLWLWLSNCALIFGALFEAELDRARQLQSGLAAEWEIIAQPRRRKRIDDRAARELGFVRMGDALRASGGQSVGSVRIADFRAKSAKRRRARAKRLAAARGRRGA
ncbi:YihY/virulence factor BrkB family protein [Brevibacterium sp. BRM-1]|uniref:YihY/virulence factor BrkB family protein n=1 Tax=Brevibacterium sp. BRM-1 TaxID=2999062 RepID=UPI002282FCBF|nr:YihY/virulence factor BrkB family protein [Brevibacterium sp. BRM-1]WAL39810.1 YihY/virulence factor BrkB family protein [Brevibacterium sp. BRM-1]